MKSERLIGELGQEFEKDVLKAAAEGHEKISPVE